MLTYSLSERKEQPLYEFLYQCIKRDIETGAILPGEKLPSKRKLAQHLGVSLITVEGAYTQLIAEGYVVAKERKGYYASKLLSESFVPSMQSQPTANLLKKNSSHAKVPHSSKVPFGSSYQNKLPSTYFADVTGTEVARGKFPYATWSKSIRDTLSCEPEQALIGNSDAAGSLRLRQVIASYLCSFRGMDVSPECIVVGAGSQVLDNMIVQLLGQQRCYGIESPGYPRLSRLYQANNAELAYIPLDEKGVVVSALDASKVSVMHVMPSHQFPTGIVTPISRRYELLAWASEGNERYLIEDDFDSEFRLTGRPIPSMQSIDTQGKVIYTNTFSKTLGPAFRLGYMVLPQALKEQFDKKLSFYSCTVSAVDQLALARFIEQGDYERHVNRMRTYYRSLRDALIVTLMNSSFAPRLSLHSQDSGIHFVMELQTSKPEQQLAQTLRSRGINIAPLSEFYFDEALDEGMDETSCHHINSIHHTNAALYSNLAHHSPATHHKNQTCHNNSTRRNNVSSLGARFLVSYSGLAKEAIPKMVKIMEEVF